MYRYTRLRSLGPASLQSSPESLISDAFAFAHGARGLTSAETYFSVGSNPRSERTRGTTDATARGYVDEIS